MIPKPLDDVEQKDIEALRDEEVAEGRTLEYKEKLPGQLPDEKRELITGWTTASHKVPAPSARPKRRVACQPVIA